MIAYDTNVAIYFLEDNPHYSKVAEKIMRHGAGVAVSVLLTQEVLTGFAAKGDTAGYERAYQFLTSLPNTQFSEVGISIVDRAGRLTLEYGRQVRGYDAIHLATALENGVTKFYTNDHDLLQLGQVDTLQLCALDSSTH